MQLACWHAECLSKIRALIKDHAECLSIIRALINDHIKFKLFRSIAGTDCLITHDWKMHQA